MKALKEISFVIMIISFFAVLIVGCAIDSDGYEVIIIDACLACICAFATAVYNLIVKEEKL